jgi:hypothetical protein
VREVDGAPLIFDERAPATRRIERKGATLASTASVIAELARDFSTPEGAELVQIMSQR